jgi:hypothetical protein
MKGPSPVAYSFNVESCNPVAAVITTNISCSVVRYAEHTKLVVFILYSKVVNVTSSVF